MMESIQPEPDPVILMTGEDWAKMFNHHILDPDGWRADDGVSFTETRITEESYLRRYDMCTIKPTPADYARWAGRDQPAE